MLISAAHALLSNMFGARPSEPSGACLNGVRTEGQIRAANYLPLALDSNVATLPVVKVIKNE